VPVTTEPTLLATIGDYEVYHVPEIAIPTSPRWLLPSADPADIDAAKAALSPAFFGEDGRLVQSVHTYVVRGAGRTILIDTGVGNGKSRAGGIPAFDMLDTTFLARLSAMGVNPGDVDTVLCTHMHVDHLGWDTVREGDHWAPTFPNARYVFARDEYEAFTAAVEREDAGSKLIWDDTIEPIADAGLVDLVESDSEFSPALRFEDSRGHSPGHVNIVLESGGRSAVFIGDVMHNPIQVYLPHVPSALNGPETATTARIEVLSRYADTGTFVFGAHFPVPCGGYVTRTATGFAFDPIPSPERGGPAH